MKKKLLLIFSMIAVLSCIFAVSVSATEWFDAVEIIDNDGDGASDINVSDVVYNVVTEGDYKTEDALVKLSCDCAKGSHTFPAYYISTINNNNKTNCYSFSYSKLNALKSDYCGGTAEYSLANVLAYELPAGYTTAYAGLLKNAASIKYLSFAKCHTATTVGDATGGNNWLEGTPVEEVNIGPYLTKVPSYLCYNCDSLESVVIPDQITEIGTYAFRSCEKLTTVKISKNSKLTTLGGQCFRDSANIGAFYIPSGLTQFGVAGSGNSPIDGCKSLYFVSDPDDTTKPDIYYFPTTITAIVGEAFKNCTNLNSTLVFHSGITSIDNGWAFCNSNAVNVVFLGDMVNVSTTGNAWNKAIKIYFCNKNDTSSDKVSMNTSASKVFCHAEGNETHLKELNKTTEATCTTPAMTGDFCFCGVAIGEPQVGAPALGHNYTGDVTYSFTTVTEAGKKCTVCVNNCGIDEIAELAPVYTALGVSINEFSTSPYSFSSGYEINRESLELYEKEMGVSLKFGFAFNSADTFTDGEVTLDSFKLKTTVLNQTADIKFDRHDFIMSYATDEHLAKDVVIAAFIIETKGENKEVSFINRNSDTTVGVNGFDVTSYQKELDKAQATE